MKIFTWNSHATILPVEAGETIKQFFLHKMFYRYRNPLPDHPPIILFESEKVSCLYIPGKKVRTDLRFNS